MTNQIEPSVIPAPVGLTVVYEDGHSYPIVAFKTGGEYGELTPMCLNERGTVAVVQEPPAIGVSADWVPAYTVPLQIADT
jgi:hypothetical protein